MRKIITESAMIIADNPLDFDPNKERSYLSMH